MLSSPVQCYSYLLSVNISPNIIDFPQCLASARLTQNNVHLNHRSCRTFLSSLCRRFSEPKALVQYINGEGKRWEVVEGQLLMPTTQRRLVSQDEKKGSSERDRRFLLVNCRVSELSVAHLDWITVSTWSYSGQIALLTRNALLRMLAALIYMWTSITQTVGADGCCVARK